MSHTRTLFLINERRGSTFLMSILFGRPGEFAHTHKSFGDVQYPMWLPTYPPGQCRFWYHGYPHGNVIDDLIKGRPEVDMREAYTWNPPAHLEPSFYNELPGDDWKFVYLVRDPRNSISSLCKRCGFEGEALDQVFYTNCKYSKEESNSLQKMAWDPRFFILHFESLIAHPMATVVNVFAHMGLSPDFKKCQEVIEAYTTSYINTSFRDKGKGANERWKKWPTKWKNHYRDQIMPKLWGFQNLKYMEW